MNRVPCLSTAACLAVLSPMLAAQYDGEGPGVVVPAVPAPAIGPSGLGHGVSEVAQVTLTQHASLPVGTYYLSATVKFGGADFDVMTGLWTESTGSFVKSTDADHLNSAGDEFACNVSPDLRTVVLDTPPGHPVGNGNAIVATRSGPSGAFSSGQVIQGLPSGYIDPHLCVVGGKLTIMFLDGDGLWLAQLDPQAGSADYVRFAAAVPPGEVYVHSPTPMLDRDGELAGMLYASYVGGSSGSDIWFDPSVETLSSPPHRRLLDQGATWLANPDANGGRLRVANAPGANYADPLQLDIVALAGADLLDSGGAARLVAHGPASLGSPYSGTILIGVLGAGPVALPGVGGSPLALNPALLISLPIQPFDPRTGTLDYDLVLPPIPDGTVFEGVPVALGGGGIFLGNNAPLRAGKTVKPIDVTDKPANGDCPAGSSELGLTVVINNQRRIRVVCVTCPPGKTPVAVNKENAWGVSFQVPRCR